MLNSIKWLFDKFRILELLFDILEIQKLHICEKVYFDQLLDFQILLLLLLHTFLLDAGFFQWCQALLLYIVAPPTFYQIFMNNGLFQKTKVEFHD